MATSNVPDFPLFLNQQIVSRGLLRESFVKATALLQVALENDTFFQHPPITIALYLWTIYDLVDQLRLLNEQALSELRLEEQQWAENG